MRKNVTTLSDIKQAVLSLKGELVKLHINRGSVFTVKDNEAPNTHTYSYSDILCGEVKITKLAE